MEFFCSFIAPAKVIASHSAIHSFLFWIVKIWKKSHQSFARLNIEGHPISYILGQTPHLSHGWMVGWGGGNIPTLANPTGNWAWNKNVSEM